MLRQEIYNDNRRLMSEILVPLTQQIQDIKVLHEDTKESRDTVVKKIEDWKKTLQSMPGSMNGPMISSTI